MKALKIGDRVRVKNTLGLFHYGCTWEEMLSHSGGVSIGKVIAMKRGDITIMFPNGHDWDVTKKEIAVRKA